jgi:hypothetical protein
MLEARHLVKRFHGVTIVNDVSFNVQRGAWELALNAGVEHVRHVRLVACREEEHREPWRRSDRRRERYRRESRQPVADAAERHELIWRLQVNLLEQRMIAFERPAVGPEVVAVVADAIRAANGRPTIVGRVRDAETGRPAAVEVRRQRPAIIVGSHVDQPVLQAEVRLPVVLLDGRREQVPAQAEVERQVARDAEIVLHEEPGEVDEDLGVRVHEVALHAVGEPEQEARPRLACVRRAEIARIVAIEREETTRRRLRIGQRRLDEADVATELH